MRRWPCISFGGQRERIRSPLPQLILERVTAGLFYDLAGGGRAIREETGRRFEQYALRYLQAMLPGIQWRAEHAYKVRREEFRSPDILWAEDDVLRLAVECKATRMSVEARFGDDPLGTSGSDDVVKAVFQLWRYFSHCRRGLTGVALADNVVGLVLTLDNWLSMANGLVADVFEKAAAMAAAKDANILPEDRKPILFCVITDLENTLATATETSFEAAIERAVSEKRQGWMLSTSHDDVRPKGGARRPYPFGDNLGQILPWWAWFEEQRDAGAGGRR